MHILSMRLAIQIISKTSEDFAYSTHVAEMFYYLMKEGEESGDQSLVPYVGLLKRFFYSGNSVDSNSFITRCREFESRGISLIAPKSNAEQKIEKDDKDTQKGMDIDSISFQVRVFL